MNQTPTETAAPAEDEVVTGAAPDTDTPTESVDGDGQGTVSAETEPESDIEDGTAGEKSEEAATTGQAG